ncbi:MAG: PD-(D/E)XK nuclease family protein, partial [Thermomicrobiales bacterium]|nr:PD-(D/E)XK nuclease family protein [Thermomicrobiales bacterium]
GREFEAGAEAAIAERARVVVCDRDQRMARGSASDNELVVATATGLAAGDRVVLFQPLLQAEIDGWALTGVADAIDLGRSETGVLSAMIVDFKSTTSARMEHRLQLAFYDEMLEAIFAAERIAVETELAVLYRGAAGGPPEDDREIERAQRLDAAETFGVEGYLERLEHAGALRRDVRALVLGDKSEARRNLAQSFDQIPFHLDYVCDGCLYNQLCLRQSAETDDLSLIPFLRVEQKRNLQVAGVRRCADLAGIPLPSEAPSPAYNNLAMEPGLGAELDDLIVRARTYRASKGDAWPVQTWLPEGRQSSLPRCDAEMHPNLVKVYIDVEHDYLHDRIYLIGALVVGAEHGVESPERRRTIVELAAAPPDDPEIEAALLRRWIARTIAAIGEVAAPDVDGSHTAPIHLIFSDSYDQRVLMNALGRHLTTVFGATSLYDFASQLAAYTSPVLTVLSDEIRTQRNYPILCQSLQALARYLRFPWDAERPLTQLFRERYFDAAGRFEDGDIPSGDRSPWYTRRSRFSSQLPLEYAYGAWKALPAAARPDPFAPYRAVTSDDLRALHAARLEAMELIAAQLRPNPWAYKQSFDLSNLDAFQDVATNLATALDEFITIERHIALGAWKHERAISPERRILSGTSMLVRYCEDDQLPEIADYNRRVLEYEALDDRDGVSRPKCSLAPTVFRLRIDLPEPTVTPEHALSLWGAAPGDVVVASARWKVDSRLPAEERVSFSPTIRQLLTGAGVKIVDIEPPDSEAEWPAGFIDVELSGFGGGQSEFAFSHVFRGFEPDGLLTLDSSPDDWYGSFQRNVVDGLRKGKRNALFDRIAGNGPVSLESDPA